MARLARFVVPGVAHHVTQRGNGRQRVFHSNADYAADKNLLAAHCAARGAAVWGWVLMPNHVHLILVPEHEDALRAALSRVHRQYAGRVHARERRTGPFWQGRFGCVAMDEAHLRAALACVALNPVRAGLAETCEGWRWSSVHASLDLAHGDGLTEAGPVLDRTGDVGAFLGEAEETAAWEALRRAEGPGRPVGDVAFVDRVEAVAGRDPRPGKRGPKARRRARGGGECTIPVGPCGGPGHRVRRDDAAGSGRTFWSTRWADDTDQ